MLDTIRVKYPISPDPSALPHWTHKVTVTETGIRDFYILNPVIKINGEDVMLKFTYYPQDYKLNPLLMLELSLPKCIYGNNYTMLLSIPTAIEAVNKVLATIPNIPKLELSEGILTRFDMCYNHQVGDIVDDYVRAIGNLEYPHRRTKYHRNEGAEFRAKHITTKFYNKQKETGSKEATGILRQETTLQGGKEVQRVLKQSKPTLLNINREFINAYLNDDLQKLTLLDNSIGTYDTSLNTLCNTYGTYAGPYYHSFLELKMKYSRKTISKLTNTHPRSIDRRIKKIVEAGSPLTLTDTEKPLPPLRVML